MVGGENTRDRVGAVNEPPPFFRLPNSCTGSLCRRTRDLQPSPHGMGIDGGLTAGTFSFSSGGRGIHGVGHPVFAPALDTPTVPAAAGKLFTGELSL